jgi:putative ABC transport system substrate-binding protein
VAGREAALLAIRVMRGESPAKMPFVPVRKTRLIVNRTAARVCGLTLPPAVLQRAQEVIGH